jgi:sigma-B regulation protein RsbU (phosphoserine phosphatase)
MTAEQALHGREALELAELIINNSPAVLFRRLGADDPKQRHMVYVSPNISRFGYNADDFITGRIMFRDIVYPGDSERTLKEIHKYEKEGVEEYTQIYRIVTGSGEVRWIEDRTSVVIEPGTGKRYHQGIVIDIHRRKTAEEKVRKSEEKYRRIVETTSEGFLLMDENLHIVDLNDAYCRMTGYPRENLLGTDHLDLVGQGFEEALSTCKDGPNPGECVAIECQIANRDGNSVPVLIHANVLRDDAGSVIGTMAFVTDMTEQKKALSLAAEVQKNLLPHTPPLLPGLDVAGNNIPCDEIGGDYFDFLHTASSDGGFTVAVGDISGHGVDAALLMTTARAFLRMRAAKSGGLDDIIADLNQHLTKDVNESGRFMTLFCLTFHRDRTHLEWVRAGHEPALLYDPDKDRFRELKGSGLALGLDDEYVFVTNQLMGFQDRQIIIIGTDGIWESRNQHQEMFGKQRLFEVVRRNAAADARTIVSAVFDAHARFTQGTQVQDDLTLVVVKRRP